MDMSRFIIYKYKIYSKLNLSSPFRKKNDTKNVYFVFTQNATQKSILQIKENLPYEMMPKTVKLDFSAKKDGQDRYSSTFVKKDKEVDVCKFEQSEEEKIQDIIQHWIRILHIKFGWIHEFDKLLAKYVSFCSFFQTQIRIFKCLFNSIDDGVLCIKFGVLEKKKNSKIIIVLIYIMAQKKVKFMFLDKLFTFTTFFRINFNF
ncbi:hypothetical protein RFI_29275 [Reticulomyxa filosa]|uniref:Uncharacterized protein n=1 Tax=Reticulomyxa filosa TaxID=46433 RepID=X6M2J6_RETFI|nr:hypothetical protein RFI_29275 [Reticulomyxa filosa]|eukprot:ETO08114.1 hypothetical protein RFI_29275 [Reticulomyxa filosa]